MDYSFKDPAKRSLEELDVEKAERILEAIEEVAEEGLKHGNTKMIKDRRGDWIYRLKADEGDINHRVFLDYINGELKILDVLHRSKAYDGEYGNRQ